MNIVITGLPGVGKTTLIKNLAVSLKAYHPVGFYTEEIRERGIRKGFELATYDGRKGLLASIDIERRYRVGKYGVDVAGFERFLAGIAFLGSSSQLIMIDEIGKMECLSSRFITLMGSLLSSGKPVVATVALRGEGLIAEVKTRQDVTVFEITPKNRERLLDDIPRLFKKAQEEGTSETG